MLPKHRIPLMSMVIVMVIFGVKEGCDKLILNLPLVVVLMEVLSLILARNVNSSEVFHFHPKCDKQRILSLCFADDLIMFSYGDVDAEMLMRSLEEFKNMSGRAPSIAKSTVFFANVSEEMKQNILNVHYAFLKKGKCLLDTLIFGLFY